MQHKVSDLNSQVKSLESQNKQLLEKNQNDLIWIKQKQAQMKKVLDGIDQQRNQWKISNERLQFDNNFLRLELQKLKLNSGTATINESKLVEELNRKREQCNKLTADLKILQDRYKGLQTQYNEKISQDSLNNEKMISELKSKIVDIQSNNQALKLSVTKLGLRNEELNNKLNKLTDISRKNKEIQTDPAINQNEEQLKQAKKSVEKNEKYVKILESRLKQTNDYLKICEAKNKSYVDEINALKANTNILEDNLLKARQKTEEQKSKKSKQSMVKASLESESNNKVRELEQQNKLLKEMIKSVQTMVRVKQFEVERYKNRLNESKNDEKVEQSMKSNHSAKYEVKSLKKLSQSSETQPIKQKFPKIPKNK